MRPLRSIRIPQEKERAVGIMGRSAINFRRLQGAEKALIKIPKEFANEPSFVSLSKEGNGYSDDRASCEMMLYKD